MFGFVFPVVYASFCALDFAAELEGLNLMFATMPPFAIWEVSARISGHTRLSLSLSREREREGERERGRQSTRGRQGREEEGEGEDNVGGRL